jgi:superfamily II DNA or RNA helicase
MRDVPNGTLTELLDTLDDDALRRGKQFEKIVKWWLQNDPARSRNIKTVWLWDEWDDRPGRDIGVDLVAELLDGTLCAIQAKCYDAERDIPKSEIDSFISAASPRTFGQRWLVATTNGLSANARRTIHDNHVTFVPLAELQAAPLTWPTHPDALKTAKKPGKAKPRPHQQRAIRDVLKGLATNSRGQLIMACGTGKTLTALWITERLDANTTLVLVPSLNLLSQTLTEWAHNSQHWTYICVCSDDTVNKEDDQPINTTVDLPYPVTTKPSEIAHFLKSKGRKIVFSTYQSSSQVAKAQKLSGKKFDLTICDEAHRLTGKTEADYATVLDDKKIISKKRLFMTATPRTYTANVKAKAEERGVEITSMDDPNVYGPELHRLTFGEAIKQELLTDYQVVIVGVTDPQVQELIDRRELVSVNDTVTTDARTLAAHIGLAKATKDFDLARTISFHSRIKTAAQFANDHPTILDWLPATHKPQGATWTDTISGDMNTGKRRILLQQLRKEQPGRHALLTNARCLTEGVDVPSLDGVAFIDPRSSQIDIIQAVGRAIRRSPTKGIGTIVLPVLISESMNAEAALSDSSFKPVWSILNALRSHDLELAVELDQLRTQLGRTGAIQGCSSKIVMDLPSLIADLSPNFVNALTVALVENSTDDWEYWYGRLLAFAEESGHTSPVESEDAQLAAWLQWQRWSFRNRPDSYRVERANKLESVPGWTWNTDFDRWYRRYIELRDFATRTGHCEVSQKTNKPLALWLFHQRRRIKSSDPAMEPEMLRLLEQLPAWTVSVLNQRWQAKYEELKQFAKENDGPHPSQRGRHRALAMWVNAQRGRFRKKTLSRDRIERLEEIDGWTWNSIDSQWDINYQKLKSIRLHDGSLAIPVDDSELYGWCAKQRSAFRRHKLSKDRVRLLESVAGWTWNPTDDEWSQSFNSLANFAKRYGHCRLPPETPGPNGYLNTWIQTQRIKFRQDPSKFNTTRRRQLESLAGWTWEPRLERWELNFQQLSDFARKNGHCRIPKTEKMTSLRQWVAKQRSLGHSVRRRSADPLMRRLGELPGWSWTPNEDAWIEKFEQLKSFAQRHGHCEVPWGTEYQTLYSWIFAQRAAYRRKMPSLTRVRIESLQSLAGWSWYSHSEKLSRTKSVPKSRRNQ